MIEILHYFKDLELWELWLVYSLLWVLQDLYHQPYGEEGSVLEADVPKIPEQGEIGPTSLHTDGLEASGTRVKGFGFRTLICNSSVECSWPRVRRCGLLFPTS